MVLSFIYSIMIKISLSFSSQKTEVLPSRNSQVGSCLSGKGVAEGVWNLLSMIIAIIYFNDEKLFHG